MELWFVFFWCFGYFDRWRDDKLRKIFITFGRIISLLVAIVFFVGFTMLVGSMSQTETIIGLILASVAGLGTCKILKCF